MQNTTILYLGISADDGVMMIPYIPDTIEIRHYNVSFFMGKIYVIDNLCIILSHLT